MENNVKSLKKLRLGLDIGTNSIGWALLDENNKLVKKNGHTFWGVRMFNEASTAQERGNFRRNRRRLVRRKERLQITRELFAEEIYKVDPTFFERLDDSFYYTEDKRHKNIHNLFTDGYTDKEFFDEYPTIYHLRNEMLNTDKKYDIRMLYLVVANMVKYRGNFLYPGEEFNVSNSSVVEEFFQSFNDTLKSLETQFAEDETFSEVYFDAVDFSSEDFMEELKKIMVNTKGISNKKKELLNLFNVNKKSIYNELVIPLLSGTKCNVSSLTIIKHNKYEVKDIVFNDELENKIDEAIATIPELKDVLELMIQLKSVNDYYFVSKVLSDSNSLSESMVKIYENHQRDLRQLKDFVKTYCKSEYNEIFRLKEINKGKKNNYANYIGMTSVKKTERFSHCSREEFYKYIKDKISKVKNPNAEPLIKEMLDKIDNNEFLIRQNSNQNGAFPMQLNLMELKQILDVQSKYHNFLNKVEDGYSIKDKIICTFKYKLPYYLGPFNKKSKNSWIERKEGKIYPWNINDIVDVDKTAEEFIKRMQNKCTYLKGDNDYCLPKNSLLFIEYNCLSYLNKISLNGSLISPEIKNDIFNHLFLKKKQPTRKDIIEYIKANYGTVALTTTSKELPEVTCNMSSYIKMKEIFGEDFDSNLDMIENIIKDITIFEDKSILEKRLKEVYKLPKDKISQIKGLNYKGYGRLSKRLLDGLCAIDHNTGEVIGTVIEIMRNTNMNLQEIINYQDYNFLELINEENKKNQINNQEYTVNDYIDDNLFISPSFKRSLIQSYNIIKEIERIFNRPIDEYYVECNRSNKQAKKVTSSRYEKIKSIYKNCEEIAREYNIDMQRLTHELDSRQNALKSDLLYLYFTQLGKCMYSLNDIDISKLDNNYTYDIDHIYPQSLIKDDSTSNRVLVNKQLNASKTDKFLFEANVLNKQTPKFFKKLLDMELISKEKYRRLTQKEISSEELNGFVNRQLVSTNQSVKGLIELLKNYHHVEEKNIIFSKSENVSDFRKKFELVKSRTANNFHHAHDAYLNVVVGGVLHKYYLSRGLEKYKDVHRIRNERETINPLKIFTKDEVKAYNKTIWNKQVDLRRIKHDLYDRFDIAETFRTFNSNKMLHEVTILPKGQGAVAVKTTTPQKDIFKYGAINSHRFSRYVLIEVVTKKEKKVILEAIPRMYCDSNDSIKKYVNDIYMNDKNLISLEIVNYNIKTNSVMQLEKCKFVIAAKSDNSYKIKNINDRIFSYNDMITIKKIDKYQENEKYCKPQRKTFDAVVVAEAKANNSEMVLTLDELKMLLNSIYNLYCKDIYNYSNIINISTNLKTVIDKTNQVFDYTVESYIKLCSALLKLLKTNSRESADLTNIGMSTNSGVLKISKNLKPNLIISWESITGYYKKVIYEVN